MHSESYELWATWMAREESAEQCAVRLASTLTGWAAAHEIFSRWNRQGWTRAEANSPFCLMPPQVDELSQIFEKGRSYRYVPPVVWPERGYSVAAWNGLDEPRGVWFRAHPGEYSTTRIFPNSFQLQLPKRVSATANIVNTSVLRKVLLSTVLAWEPSWASITSYPYGRRFHANKPFPLFRSGWMTYLSAPYARRISAPVSAIVEWTPDGGMLLLATDETFTVENLAHVAVADEIQSALQPLQDEDERWLREDSRRGFG